MGFVKLNLLECLNQFESFSLSLFLNFMMLLCLNLCSIFLNNKAGDLLERRIIDFSSELFLGDFLCSFCAYVDKAFLYIIMCCSLIHPCSLYWSALNCMTLSTFLESFSRLHHSLWLPSNIHRSLGSRRISF